MTEDSPSAVPDQLDSWKEIAAYLKRDVSTVQRWEKREGMPIHRHLHDKQGSVYAFPAELDEWWRTRRAREQRSETLPVETVGEAEPGKRRRFLWPAAATAAMVLVAVVWWFLKPAQYFWRNPLANARFVLLTDFEGTEQAAAISRDGRFVAFLSDRDGPIDVWLTQVGTDRFQNLTGGKIRELLNRDVRTLGFSPDGTLVTLWARQQSASGSPDIAVWAVPTLGGEPKLYLDGVAEFDWSSDSNRLVYHTPAPGDPLFIRDQNGRTERKIFTAAAGLHNHYPVWSPDDESIYFVSGAVPNQMDIWRIDAAGGSPERMTSRNSRVSHLTFLNRRTLLYLATDPHGSGPWLYALDLNRRETRRISVGVEKYTSLAGSTDARRLVVTAAHSRRTLWRMPITAAVSDESAATHVPVPIVGGRSPRLGPGYLLYVSSRSGAESIWKLVGGTASELWSVAGGRIIGGPAIAPDGRRIAFTAEERGRARMYLMSSDGSGIQTFPDSLQPRGAPAWSPDGSSIAVAAMIGGTQRLVRVAVTDQTVTPITPDFAADPVWSPDGKTLVYSGPEIGTRFEIRRVTADGTVRPEPKATLSRGIRRIAFLPKENSLVVLQGEMIHKNFWSIDLDTGRERRLTNFAPNVTVGDFDVSPDGREIIFDREQDSSDIVLIDR